MPNVTVSQPSVIRVKIDGQQSKVSTINYATKSIKDSPDVDMTGAATGDVLVYDANTQIFSSRRIGSATPVTGALLPTSTRAFDLGSRTQRFRSLYLSGNTIDLDGTQMKADGANGTIAFSAPPTDDFPNPIAIVITPQGGFAPVQTVGGEIPASTNIQSIIANTATYLQFTGGDAGFF
jgi:hypothetical protein